MGLSTECRSHVRWDRDSFPVCRVVERDRKSLCSSWESRHKGWEGLEKPGQRAEGGWGSSSMSNSLFCSGLASYSNGEGQEGFGSV